MPATMNEKRKEQRPLDGPRAGLSTRVDQVIFAEIESYAHEERRTMSQMTHILLEEALEARRARRPG